jgi:hypothetical protein
MIIGVQLLSVGFYPGKKFFFHDFHSWQIELPYIHVVDTTTGRI